VAASEAPNKFEFRIEESQLHQDENMSAVIGARGRVLSSQQVRFNEAPIRLADQSRCLPTAERISVKTDPASGDVISIVVQCECGEVITVVCAYEDAA